jgi:hypothetical protein
MKNGDKTWMCGKKWTQEEEKTRRVGKRGSAMVNGNGEWRREEGGEMKRKRRGGGKMMEQREKNGALGEKDGKRY